MADALEAVDRARTAVAERVELPGMSLLDHLNELRKRFVHVIVALVLAFFVAYGFHERIFVFMQEPITFALKKHHLDRSWCTTTLSTALTSTSSSAFWPGLSWLRRTSSTRSGCSSRPGSTKTRRSMCGPSCWPRSHSF